MSQESNKLIWKNISPKWDFDNSTFDRTAASLDNLDHVSIVIRDITWPPLTETAQDRASV